MPKPNFLIVGAAKSGTTSAYEYLRQHPDVYMPDWKEPSFFAPPEAGGVPGGEPEYLDLFHHVNSETAIGEASVAYLCAPESAQRIYEYLGPDTKIIIFLRNPVDMAYSLWAHQCREAEESLSFEEGLRAESERLEKYENGKLNNSWIHNFSYLKRATYKPQIERYDRLFSKDKIKIYIFEEFFQDNLPLYGDLCSFIGITDRYKPAPKIYNAAGKMRSDLLRRILRERMAWKEPLKKLFPEKTRFTIKAWLEKLNRVKKEAPPIKEKTRKMLEEQMQKDVEWVEERLGRSLKDVWF